MSRAEEQRSYQEAHDRHVAQMRARRDQLVAQLVPLADELAKVTDALASPDDARQTDRATASLADDLVDVLIDLVDCTRTS